METRRGRNIDIRIIHQMYKIIHASNIGGSERIPDPHYTYITTNSILLLLLLGTITHPSPTQDWNGPT